MSEIYNIKILTLLYDNKKYYIICKDDEQVRAYEVTYNEFIAFKTVLEHIKNNNKENTGGNNND